MSLFLKDFNGVVRFFPKIFFHLVASFGHCVQFQKVKKFNGELSSSLSSVFVQLTDLELTSEFNAVN